VSYKGVRYEDSIVGKPEIIQKQACRRKLPPCRLLGSHRSHRTVSHGRESRFRLALLRS